MHHSDKKERYFYRSCGLLILLCLLFHLRGYSQATPPPLLSKISATDKSVSDRFGWSIAQSGSTIAIGAFKNDNNGFIDHGAAYLYKMENDGTSTFLSKVTATDGANNDLFGYSISLSGNTLAVGAVWSDPGGLTDAGAVYLYQLQSNGSPNSPTKIIAHDKAANDFFGATVSLSGSLLAVGAPLSAQGGIQEAGAVYLYRVESNGSATFLSKVTAPDMSASAEFGFSVSLSGNTLAVGARYASPGGVNEAGASIFSRVEANGAATHLSTITANDKAPNDEFGSIVSMSGNILAVGAYKADISSFSDAGATYLYRLEANGNTTFLSKVTAQDKAVSDEFGNSVSMAGNILAVGASFSDSGGQTDSGATYLYRLQNDGSTTFLSKITANDKAPNDEFGGAVSISGNFPGSRSIVVRS